MKTTLFLALVLALSSCHTEIGEQVVVAKQFIHNRVKVRYYVSIECPNGSASDSINGWINNVVNDHLRWVYDADSAACLQYKSKDFASQYRAYVYLTAQQYDKDLRKSGNNVGRGEALQNDTLRIYKTSESMQCITYTAEEYFCWGTTHPTRYKIRTVFDKDTGKCLVQEIVEME